jgi:hypothetical protein
MMMLPVQFIYQLWKRSDDHHRYRYVAVHGPDEDRNFWLVGIELSFAKVDGKHTRPHGPFPFFLTPPSFPSIEEAESVAEAIYQEQLAEGWNKAEADPP